MKSFFTVLLLIQKNNIKGQEKRQINTGNYLRFRGVKLGYDQIPTLINRVKRYFAENPYLRRAKDRDFLIDKQTLIDIYIPVEKPIK